MTLPAPAPAIRSRAEACPICGLPVYWVKDSKGWRPLDGGSDRNHLEACPDAAQWKPGRHAREIKPDEPEKFIARLGTDILIIRSDSGGVIEVARQGDTFLIAAVNPDGMAVPLKRDPFVKAMRAVSRWLLGVELDDLVGEE